MGNVPENAALVTYECRSVGGACRREELGDLLKENFLRYKEGEPIQHQILSWMKQSAKHRPKIAAEERPNGIPEIGLATAGLAPRDTVSGDAC